MFMKWVILHFNFWYFKYFDVNTFVPLEANITHSSKTPGGQIPFLQTKTTFPKSKPYHPVIIWKIYSHLCFCLLPSGIL